MTRTVLVVPCYNEEHRLPLQAFTRSMHEPWFPHVIFVNDGSTDGTKRLLENFCAAHPEKFEALSLEKNVGKGNAVWHGLRRAIELQCEFVAYWDADLATPLDELPVFEQVLQSDAQLHVVLGSRVRLMGREIDRKLIRHLAGRVFATAASLALDLPVYDTQCGAKLLRVSPALIAALGSPFTSRWLFDIELLFRLGPELPRCCQVTLHRALYEQPLRTWRDVRGSKVHPIDFFRAFVQLSKLRLRYGPPAK